MRMTLILVFGAKKKRLKMEGALSVIKALLTKTDVKKNVMGGRETAFKIRAENMVASNG